MDTKSKAEFMVEWGWARCVADSVDVAKAYLIQREALLDFKKQYPLSPWIHDQVDKALKDKQ